MSSTLAKLQSDFIAYLHHGKAAPSILSQICPPQGCTAVTVMDQYRDAYHLRLRRLLGQHCPALKKWMGERAFDDAVDTYLAMYPPRHFALREVGRHWPTFLAATFPAQPGYGQMAVLEYTYLDLMHQSKDESPIELQQYLETGLPPDAWVLHLSSSLRVHAAPPSLLSIWEAALHEGNASLPLYRSVPVLNHYLLWQQGAMPYYQLLTPPLLFLLYAIRSGKNLQALSVGLMPWWAHTDTAQQLMLCLQTWMQAGVLVAAPVTHSHNSAGAV